jgi:hypothetical protein
MSNNTKAFLSAVLAYLATRVGFALLQFEPTRDLETLLGYAVDIAIWVVVFSGVYWLLTTAMRKGSDRVASEKKVGSGAVER